MLKYGFLLGGPFIQRHSTSHRALGDPEGVPSWSVSSLLRIVNSCGTKLRIITLIIKYENHGNHNNYTNSSNNDSNNNKTHNSNSKTYKFCDTLQGRCCATLQLCYESRSCLEAASLQTNRDRNASQLAALFL